MTRKETIILNHLIFNDEYTRKVLPYIKEEYFNNESEKMLFRVIDEYVKKYNVNPSLQAVNILINEVKMNERQKEDVDTILKDIESVKSENLEWLIDNTEEFCKERAIFNGIMEAVAIIENTDKTKSRDAIPQILQDALAICFDPSIGHDYVEDFEKRFEFYHNVVERVPFDIDILNKITKKGLPNKSLSIFLAGCIHPDTVVKLKYDDEEKEHPISYVKLLLKEGKLVQIYSPDGWVKINKYVQKGMYEEYCLNLDDGRFVRCNGDHLFETTFGWRFASDLALIGEENHFLTDNEYVLGFVNKVEDSEIPIVDIEVDHENHRYYANGVSSHNTGVGKSMVMCHLASSALSLSKNVLYITMEMSEEMIAERIDANLFDVNISELSKLSKDNFTNNVMNLQKKSSGKLIIKEYPTSTAHAGHFKHLMSELKLKKKFIPDIIFVDYINICSSQRYKSNGNIGSYHYIKSISEELRAIAVEFDVPVVSATQTNRGAHNSSDPGMEDTSESYGLNFVADLVLALISSEDLEKMNQMMFKQIKNRHNNLNYYNKFVVGIDRTRMRLFDCESHASNELVSTRDEEVTKSVFVDLTSKKPNFSNLKT